MKNHTKKVPQPFMQVDDAFDKAAKLIGKNFKVASEDHRAAMILCGLLTLAFILECKDES